MDKENIREKYFHDLIINNDNIKYDLLSLLGLPNDLSRLKLVHEDKFINGIIVDFTLIYDNKIRALIEVKAGDIGVTDYVRGIGQTLQYEYFKLNNISPKNIEYSNDFNTILVIPSSVVNNQNFNIGMFEYPKSNLIFEINESNEAIREITKKELNTLSQVENSTLTSISQYYVRDTRLFEIYMLLRYLCFLKLKNEKNVNRKYVEFEMKKTNTINNNNWRNVWISLSSFGFIDSNNLPTKSGTILGMNKYEDFLIIMYKSYIKPYIEVIMEYLTKDTKNLNNSLKKINEDIVSKFSSRDVLFLTQSKTRYLSSWLNILRDDFGCVEFAPKNSKRDLNYNPLELNENFLKQKIVKYTKSKDYIKNLKNIL
jgi:hypothetical protein